MGGSTPEDLKKRVKELLNESANKRCSECRSKKHKPKFFSLLKTPERGQLGVFCCKNCSEFHLALGADYATVKSLKHPEEWTEQDVETLETSGNEAVNKIYESGMHGNHTEKHMGALASAAFVESKYKMCLYFSSEVYEEQMQLRAMARFAKEGKAREKPPPPTTEDKVKSALRRQTMISSKPAGNDEEPVLLRGFGSSCPTSKEEEEEEEEEEEVDEEEYQRRINAARPRLERKGSVAARRAGPRRAVSADGGIPISGPLRRTKKPVPGSDAKKPIRRSNTHDFDNSSHRNGGHRDRDMSKSRSRRNLLDSSEASKKSRRHLIDNGQRPSRGHRKAPSDGIDGNSGHRHRSNSRGHRKGPSEGIESSSGHRRRSHRSADGERLHRTHTAGEPFHREKSGQAIRRAATESGQRPRKGPKRVESSSSKQNAPHSNPRGDEIPTRSMRKSRERSVSPARSRSGHRERASSPKEAMWERSGRKQREHGGDRSQRSNRSPIPRHSNSSSYSDELHPSESLLEDEESTVEVSSEDDEITVSDSVVKRRESWSQHIESLTRGKGKVKELEKLDENSEKDVFKDKRAAAEEKTEENEQGEKWTDKFDDSVVWSRNVHKPANTKKKKRPSGKAVVGDNKLGQSTTAIFQKAFANPEEPERVKQPKESTPSWVDELAHVSEHDLGADIPGFSTSFVDMGFGDFGGTNQEDDDDDDGRLLQGIALSSQ